MTLRSPARRRLATASVLALTCFSFSACNAGSAQPGGSDDESGAGSSRGAGNVGQSEDGDAAATPTLSSNVADSAADVAVSTLLTVAADGGTLSSVKVTSAAGVLPGALGTDGASWTAGDRLEPATTYTVAAVADNDGTTARRTSTFTTQALTLDEQTYPSVAPLAGETVGVGMPVVVSFDLPVSNKAEFERNMRVETVPQQAGSWRWMTDNEAHWRPKTYWKPGTEVSVDVDVNGVEAGNGIYGQENREIDFEVGDANVYKVNAQTHQMQVFSNGELLRTFPITTGKEGFTTRSGVKVIMEKFDSKRMNSETVGIAAGSSESYDIDNVQWAMRITNSGEFIHAAPWSVGSQGYANVSHGCTGMSTADASFLYDMSKRGDVVEYVGTDRPMTLDNGYGDWNAPFPEYAAGSAL